MSDWTAAELSARGPNAQPCTSAHTASRWGSTWLPSIRTVRGHTRAIGPGERTKPGQLTYGRYGST
eukprot:5521418-Prymnesium_polylepis.1